MTRLDLAGGLAGHGYGEFDGLAWLKHEGALEFRRDRVAVGLPESQDDRSIVGYTYISDRYPKGRFRVIEEALGYFSNCLG